MEQKYSSVEVDDVCALCEYTISGLSRTFSWRKRFTVYDLSVEEIASRVYQFFYQSVSCLQLPAPLVSFSIKFIKLGDRILL